MKTRLYTVVLAAAVAVASMVTAQDAAAPVQEEVLVDPAAAAAAPTGPQWRAFSRSANSAFLINRAEFQRDGDEVKLKIARVALARPAGDYSHVMDDFAVRCEANESRLVASTEAYEDGEPTDTYETDEPWSPIQDSGFDHAVKQIACDGAEPTGAPFATVRAYIDAGRP